MKKITLLLLLSTFVLTAKSQEFLNASKSEIQKKIIAQGGVLKGKSDFAMLGVFPKDVFEKNDIYNIMFILKQGKCCKYMIRYGSDKNLKSVVAKFDNPNSGFKRKDKGFNWINSKDDEISVLDNYSNSIKTNAFWLDIRTKEGLTYPKNPLDTLGQLLKSTKH